MPTVVSTQNGNFATGSTWVGGVAPTASDAVDIRHNVTTAADTTVANMTISVSNKGLAINAGKTLTVTGNMTNSGDSNTVDLAANAAVVVGGIFNFSGGAVITMGGGASIDATGVLSMSGGSAFSVAAGDVGHVTARAGVSFVGASGGNLDAGTLAITAVTEVTGGGGRIGMGL